jgi:hypothetical protein
MLGRLCHALPEFGGGVPDAGPAPAVLLPSNGQLRHVPIPIYPVAVIAISFNPLDALDAAGPACRQRDRQQQDEKAQPRDDPNPWDARRRGFSRLRRTHAFALRGGLAIPISVPLFLRLRLLLRLRRRLLLLADRHPCPKQEYQGQDK